MHHVRPSAAALAAAICAAAALAAGPGAVRAQDGAAGAAELALGAISLVGTPYRHGGDRPASGFDCSGLVRYVAGSALGVELPRQAEAISRVGLEVRVQQLQPGDLVFFNTRGRPFSHVGVYLGDEQFVHAPARQGQVRIERMSLPYWRSRFNGARRLGALLDPPAPLAADGRVAADLAVAEPPYTSVEP